MDKRLLITEYSDPADPWCLALEPAVRKLRFLCGCPSEIRHRIALPFVSIHEVVGKGPAAGTGFEKWKAAQAEEYRDAALFCGMPVSTARLEGMTMQEADPIPMAIAFSIVRLRRPEEADRFLRSLREAALMLDCPVHSYEYLEGLAAEHGIAPEDFRASMGDGSAANALQEDLLAMRQAQIRKPPVLRIEYTGAAAVISGCVSWEQISSEIRTLSGGEEALEEKDCTEENVRAYLAAFGLSARSELALAFSGGGDRLDEVLDRLVTDGAARRVPAPARCLYI